MRCLGQLSRRAMDWYRWAPLSRVLQRALLWCLVLFGAAQVLLWRPRSSEHRPNVAGSVAAGRVVITGGGGNIGKHIAQHLLASSTAVTIVDRIFYPDELGPSNLVSNSLLTLHIGGDIRNTTLLSSVFTSDVVGVVHLAGISRVVHCEENPPDCTDVNERGTQLVLDSLEQLNKQDQGKRWFVLASSLAVYGDATTPGPIGEDAPTKPSSVYGASKLAAERTVEARARSIQSSNNAGTLYAVALRLSHVYGSLYDPGDRLIPSLVTQALWNQVIQVSGGEQFLDLLHIDDCVDAFLFAIQHLTRAISLNGHVRGGPIAPTIFEVFNVASGQMMTVSGLVDKVISLTQSISPIRNIPRDTRFSNIPTADVQKVRRQLGFRASTNINKGLIVTLQTYLRHFEELFSRRIEAGCGTPPPTPSLNMQIDKLHGCMARIHINDQGLLSSLSAPGDDQPFWAVGDEILGAGLYVKASTRPSAGNKRVFQIRDIKDSLYLGVKNPANGPISIGRISESDLKSDPDIYADWEIEANPDTSVIRLILSGTQFQLAGPKPSDQRMLRLIPKNDKYSWPFRITPVCCPTPGPWPFTADDPVDFSIEYQRESAERPFLASPREALCTRLETARKRVRGKLAALSSSSPHKLQRDTSAYAANWSLANLPACSNLCEDTTICVDTGDCQCVASSCVHRQRTPFPSATHRPGVSFPHRTEDNEPLVEAVKRISWKDLIRPLPLRFIEAEAPYPRIRVAPLSPNVKAFVDGLDRDVGHLKSAHCFSADAQLERGVARMGVQDHDAEMTFVPLYWAQFPTEQLYFEQYDYVKEHLEGFDPGRAVVPFTQDWGQCMTFMWNVWALREKYGKELPLMVRNTTAWSVMGDLNSICYRPHQDVIIPPRTCVSPDLFTSFGDVSHVRPSRDRRVLASFRGSLWGTGEHTRARLQCTRSGWAPDSPEHRLHPNGPALSVMWGSIEPYDYMGILNDTVFCPQPAGTTGWSTRLIDSMYAGCIPVFIGHAMHPPFFDILDWSRLSVRVEPHELSSMEELLLSRFSLKDIEQLQMNILAIRNALVYPLDDEDTATVQRKLLDERGPLFFALHSTRMKLMTKWPI